MASFESSNPLLYTDDTVRQLTYDFGDFDKSGARDYTCLDVANYEAACFAQQQPSKYFGVPSANPTSPDWSMRAPPQVPYWDTWASRAQLIVPPAPPPPPIFGAPLAPIAPSYRHLGTPSVVPIAPSFRHLDTPSVVPMAPAFHHLNTPSIVPPPPPASHISAPRAPRAPPPFGCSAPPPAPAPEWQREEPFEEEWVDDGSDMSYELESSDSYAPPPPPPKPKAKPRRRRKPKAKARKKKKKKGKAAQPTPMVMDEDDPECPQLTWTNVVVTVNGGVKIELKDLLTKCANAEWRPTKFPACVLRKTNPKSTALVFGSGKMVITGNKNIPKAKIAARAHVSTLQKLGWDAKYKEFKVVNLSAMMAFGSRLNLASIQAHLGDKCKYNPDRYPGLTWKLPAINGIGKATLTVFATGKVVLVGCKSEVDAKAAAKLAYPIIELYGM